MTHGSKTDSSSPPSGASCWDSDVDERPSDSLRAALGRTIGGPVGTAWIRPPAMRHSRRAPAASRTTRLLEPSVLGGTGETRARSPLRRRPPGASSATTAQAESPAPPTYPGARDEQERDPGGQPSPPRASATSPDRTRDNLSKTGDELEDIRAVSRRGWRRRHATPVAVVWSGDMAPRCGLPCCPSSGSIRAPARRGTRRLVGRLGADGGSAERSATSKSETGSGPSGRPASRRLSAAARPRIGRARAARPVAARVLRQSGFVCACPSLNLRVWARQVGAVVPTPDAARQGCQPGEGTGPRRVLSGGRVALVATIDGGAGDRQRARIGAGVGAADRTQPPRRVAVAVQATLVVAIAWPGCGEHEVDPVADRGGDQRMLPLRLVSSSTARFEWPWLRRQRRPAC